MRRASDPLVMLCSFALIGVVACSGRAPEGARGEALPVTADGLQLVVDEADRTIYVKPGMALEDFSQLLIDPFMVSYTSPRDATDGPVRTLDDETEKRLASAMQEALNVRMERSRIFEIVEQPGPQALRA